MHVAHLTSSRFFGGPERQMLGLAQALQPECKSCFISFSEDGLCRSFLRQAESHGFEAHKIEHDTPRLLRAERALTSLMQRHPTDVLLCHGYKANVLGRIASWRLGIPAIAVSRGWTFESRKVRAYETVDRAVYRWMDHVVCVSAEQARRVRRCGVRPQNITVIRNAVDTARFDSASPHGRDVLEKMFPHRPRLIVGAAGRLSPEKGFDVLVEAAATVCRQIPEVGFVLFGDGSLRDSLLRQIDRCNLADRFVLGGFRGDLDTLMPHFDLFAQSSHTEGLPNVILESLAAGVPVVATAVGGTPEVLEEGVGGYLVPAGNASALADRIRSLLLDDALRDRMGKSGSQVVKDSFSFASQARAYKVLFERECGLPSNELVAVAN